MVRWLRAFEVLGPGVPPVPLMVLPFDSVLPAAPLAPVELVPPELAPALPPELPPELCASAKGPDKANAAASTIALVFKSFSLVLATEDKLSRVSRVPATIALAIEAYAFAVNGADSKVSEIQSSISTFFASEQRMNVLAQPDYGTPTHFLVAPTGQKLFNSLSDLLRKSGLGAWLEEGQFI